MSIYIAIQMTVFFEMLLGAIGKILPKNNTFGHFELCVEHKRFGIIISSVEHDE